MSTIRCLFLYAAIFCLHAVPFMYGQGTITASVDTEITSDESEPVAPVEVTDEVPSVDETDVDVGADVTVANADDKKTEDKHEKQLTTVEQAPETQTAQKTSKAETLPEKQEQQKPAPELVQEKLETEKIIEETVTPKVFAPVPDIDETTESSKQLQEESKQVTSGEVAVDDKEFAEEKQDISTTTSTQELPMTLDTTAVDAEGNWLLKRAFWEQAERAYEKIMAINSAIYDQQIKFVKARNEADDLSDSSFRKLGFEQGQLSGLFDGMLAEIKQQREQQLTFSAPERQLLKSLNEKQQELEQLKLNLESIEELDNTLDKSMLNLNNQVKNCRDYEKQAWDHFKAIGRELNDKKARLLFYEMQGYLRTVEKNKDYFAGQLWTHFASTVDLMKKKFGELESALGRMRQRGVDFAKELEKFAQASRDKELGALASEREKLQKEQAQLEQQVEKQKAEKAACPNMWAQMQTITLNAWHYTTDLFVGFFERAWTWLRSFLK